MAIKIVTKLHKEWCLFFILFFTMLQIGYSQSTQKVYFLVDKTDTLIKRQFNLTTKEYSSYLIINEDKIKDLNKTPIVEGKVWIPESEDDFYTFGLSFSFDAKNDSLVSKEYLETLNIIKNRKEFLNIDHAKYSLSGNNYYFIEPTNCDNLYILREVFPLVFE